MKKLFTSIITAILLILFATTIYAANAYNINIVPSKQQLLPGDEITVTFRLEDIQTELGIGAVYGKLEYDKKVFEKVLQDDFSKVEGWELPIYNSENEREGALFLLTETGDTVKENTNIFSIKMKVLDKVPSKNTQIKLTQISSSTGEEDIELQDVAVDFVIEGNMATLEVIWVYIIIGVVAVAVAIVIFVLAFKKKK